MKKILAALIIIAALAGCKKEAINNTGTPVSGKQLVHVSYVYDGMAPETDDLTYDAKGRLLTYANDDYNYSFSYESETRLVVTSRKKSDNSPGITFECTLNNKGAITQMLLKNPAGDLTYTYLYAYNSDNQMNYVKGAYPLGAGDFEIKAEIVNGDITTVQRFRDGSLVGNGIYKYEGAIINRMPGTLTNQWLSKTLFGKTIKHLSTEYKYTTTAGVLDWHTTTTYELDADGDVTEATTNYILDGTAGVATYRYQ
jgi:hypothetical protein